MTARFRGRYEIKLDPKGRLSLPAALRDALFAEKKRARGPALVLAAGLYQNKACLHAYSAAAWAALEARVARLPGLKPEVQAFQRFYLSGGQELEVDGQGRMLIPQTLRKRAALDESATLVGMGEKFEIWSTESWRGVEESLALSFEDTLAAIARLEAEA